MDASCGPSTPLTALQKHAGADRSLQQDRFGSSSSSSSAAGFRSRDQQHDGQAHALDAQFSSFVAQQGGNPDLVAREFSHLSIAQQQQQQQQRHLQAIFEQEQAQFHHQQQQHPQQSMESWHQDFMQFLEQPAPALSQQQPIMSSQQQPMTTPTPYMPTFSAMPTTGMYNNFAYNNTEQAYEPAHLQQQQQKVFDDAFDQIEQETATTTSSQTVQDEPVQTAKPEVDDDDDGLSAVAGDLLQSLRDNQSQKFKESTFLALMRRLRDKEVVVQGNKMVESIADPAAANEKMGMEGMEAGADYMPFSAAEETGREAGAQGFRRGAWEESF
ncbi:hypothetical protein BZA70DRAFT_83296 [Myxozyma melibiosi]|uniref:Peroxin 20 n=1 Tax=Myxozyma melibiosi TaxID=54550 RepID=A0ABR1EZW7_9ASCO